MDLALLVYGISLLHKISAFFIALTFIAVAVLVVSLIYRGAELSINTWDGPDRVKWKQERLPGTMKLVWVSAIAAFFLTLANIFIPSEKTAYTMVGAYAAQKVVEDPRVQDMSSKVLTIINQKLDHYVDEGLAEAEKRLEKANGKSNSKN
jgi:lysylphosphatidylglycerol synthetase-like protein (DUF2156 family)